MGTEQRRATFYLVIREGTEAEQVVVWDTVDVTLGRRDGSDIVLEDAEVSRDHSRFHRRGEQCVVEDLGTGLGTFVNGERISSHPLQHGDLVKIASVEIRFGRTLEPIQRASNVSYASELKEFGLVASGDAAGQTMLAFDTEDAVPGLAREAPIARRVRAVTLDGEVDLADPNSTLMDLGLADDFGDVARVRQLDLEVAADLPRIASPDDPHGTSPTAPTLVNVGATPLAQPSHATASITTVRLALEVEGPPDKVEEFLSALRDKRISVPPLSLLLRDL